MRGTPSPIADLLADCEALGIWLMPDGDNELTIDAPPEALTPELLGRLKAHKAGLLALLRPAASDLPDRGAESQRAAQKPAKPICRCGSTTWQDVPIHDGQSIRRDCARCGRFLDFPVWYGKATLHREQ